MADLSGTDLSSVRDIEVDLEKNLRLLETNTGQKLPTGASIRVLLSFGDLVSGSWAHLNEGESTRLQARLGAYRRRLETLKATRGSDFEATVMREFESSAEELGGRATELGVPYGRWIRELDASRAERRQLRRGRAKGDTPMYEVIDIDDFDTWILADRDMLQYVIIGARVLNLPTTQSLEALARGVDERLREVVPLALESLAKRRELREIHLAAFPDGFWWRTLQHEAWERMPPTSRGADSE